MFEIKDLRARQILDSRGNPTVEADLVLRSGAFGRASVPSGASVGSREALELRDNDPMVYKGRGVLSAVHNVNVIIRNFVLNNVFSSQREFDTALLSLDGTSEKRILGANSILAVSLAFAKAAAAQSGLHLFQSISHNRNLSRIPRLMLNFINGGAHADNEIEMQEFMIVPQTSDVAEALRIASEVFCYLREILKAKGYSTNVGDEGGFAPSLSSIEQVLDILSEAVLRSGFKLGEEVSLALDAAANEFFRSGFYCLKSQGANLTSDEFVEFYKKLVDAYPICSIEDPLAENDLIGWRHITEVLGGRVQLIGDDLFVTNTEILRSGIKNKLANALLVKMNQVGTLTETLEAVNLAHASGYDTIVSHRSGETEDATIAHLAVAVGSKYIKAGSICRTDRVCKYNELLRIAELV